MKAMQTGEMTNPFIRRNRGYWITQQLQQLKSKKISTVQWVLLGKPKKPTRINLVHSGGFGVLLKLMLLVIWVLGMQGTMSLCMMLSSMLVMIMSMKGMAMRHFMMMSRFMMVT